MQPGGCSGLIYQLYFDERYLDGDKTVDFDGVESVDIGVGGSIPFIADLVREFPGAQILVTGVEDPHAKAHSPNESLHLETFRNAVLAEALLLEKLDARTAQA